MLLQSEQADCPICQIVLPFYMNRPSRSARCQLVRFDHVTDRSALLHRRPDIHGPCGMLTVVGLHLEAQACLPGALHAFVQSPFAVSVGAGCRADVMTASRQRRCMPCRRLIRENHSYMNCEIEAVLI